jgi:AAA+ superfamily predicted ATPase
VIRSSATVREPQARPQEFHVVPANTAKPPGIYIPPRFSEPLILHFVKNILAPTLEAPVLMLIQGPAGEGKTMQTLVTCARYGVDLIILPGYALSGEQEREPVEILRRAYLEGSAMRQVARRPVMLLIEDLDTSVAAVLPDRRYSMNSQLLSGALMALTQDPYHLGEVVTERVPIIATGNDLTSLYGPLMRHGRATIIDWVPTREDKVEIVRHLFRDNLAEVQRDEVERLVDHFSGPELNLPIAFYEVLRNSVFDDVILETIRSVEHISLPDIYRALESAQLTVTIDDLMAIGERLRLAAARRFLSS